MKIILGTIWAIWIFAASVNSANATVIYDWVTTSLNPGDCGSRVEVYWQITDEEYRTGEFSLQTPGDAVFAAVEIFYNQHSYMYGDGVIGPLGNVTGMLDLTKSRIQSVHHQEGFDFLALVDGTADCSLGIGPNYMVGGWFDAVSPHQIWDRNGEWVVRASTIPPVPEPGTLLLFAVGLGSVIIFGRGGRPRPAR